MVRAFQSQRACRLCSQRQLLVWQVLIDGVDLREVDSAWYRRQIGVVSQDPHLFGMDIAANIAYGLEGELSLEVQGFGCRVLGFRVGTAKVPRPLSLLICKHQGSSSSVSTSHPGIAASGNGSPRAVLCHNLA